MKPKIVIVGLGRIGSELAIKLKDLWEVIGIDIDPGRAESTEKDEAYEGIIKIFGDSTSSITLKRAITDQVHCLIATTKSDEVNLETCRLAKEIYGINHLIALINYKENAQKYDEVGVHGVNIPLSISNILESLLDKGKVKAISVGLGQGEIVEVNVLARSPLVGRPLNQIKPEGWLIGAIYRNGRLVIPGGKSTIEVGDKALLIGDPAFLSTLAEIFQSGVPQFPLQFGSHPLIFIFPSLEAMDEGLYLTKNSRAGEVHIFIVNDAKEKAIDKCAEHQIRYSIKEGKMPVEKSMEALLQQDSYGFLVLPFPKKRFLGFLSPPFSLVKIIDQVSIPILISRGTFPYENILVILTSETPLKVIELGIDIARPLTSKISAVSVHPPSFLASNRDEQEKRTLRDLVNDMSSIYKLSIDYKQLEGNPVKEILKIANNYDLIVMAYKKGRKNSLLKPYAPFYILKNSTLSVLMLPVEEEDGS
ncbi:MAG: NAD-binding protein [Nitrospinae bacterium]|nr:NAD-binding protein [Nitrospinota bacterium]